MRQQSTLRTTVSIDGVGLHSGHPARAHFHPAPVNHGLVFVRREHAEQPIPADLDSAATFDYATTLRRGSVSIGTVEHVLAAAAGLGLDNCLIEIEGPEVPILDGSALPFVRLFHAAGFERHEVLDLIGDLALLGQPLQGRIHARKAGHAVHIEFARALHAALTAPVQEVEESESVGLRVRNRRQRS